MLRTLFLVIICTSIFAAAIAQNAPKYTISGHINDAQNGEELIGATIYVTEVSAGTSTNVYGFYSYTLPKGKYTVTYQYIGFAAKTMTVNLTTDTTLNVELSQDVQNLNVVEITAEKNNRNVESVEMSTITLPIQTIKKIPAIFGEVDIIKTIQLLPGITGAGEGVGGFYVRGGGVDQNLILLDEAPVYNASHLLGFFSVFNSDAIKDMQIYKGGIPAEYGGRLSSLLDIRMKDGNAKRFGISGGIGVISSRLTIEAPIIKNKMSFFVSGRRTYVDLFLKLHPDKDIRKNKLFFYDLNAKYNWRINDKNRIFASGYFGRDVFSFGDEFFTNWGNATATFRWNHLFSEKLFSNFTFIFSDFNYSLGVPKGALAFDWDAKIRDYSFKADLSYFANKNNTIKFGVIATHHTFTPGQVTPLSDNSIFNGITIPEKHAIEYAAYVSNEQRIGDKITLQYGLRYSLFNNIGKGQEFEYDSTRLNVTDTTFYGNFEGIQMYHAAEPRFSMRYGWNAENAIKLSYNRTRQYLHLISNSTVSSPLDIWVPAGRYIKPATADQVAIGYFRNFKDNMYEFSVEGYYKFMQDVIDYRDNAELLLNDKIENEILVGDGYSMGLEFLVKKSEGRFTGWIAYTLSKTRKKVPGINDNKYYAATNDRTHDLAVVALFHINERWSIGANFVFQTGLAVTFPAGRFNYQGINAPIYTERNGYRLPAYHRLDLSVDYSFPTKPEKHFTHSLNISIYNAYYAKNAFSITFKEDEDNPGQTAAYKTYLFPIIPSVTYNFNF